MRLGTKDALATRGQHLRWLGISAGLGVLLGWVSARPLGLLHVGNVLLWTIAAIFIAKQRGGHLRKWARLATFGFTIGVAYMWFDYTGADTFVQHLPALLFFGAVSAVCAVPSGGLIHAVFAWQMHRASQRRERAQA